MPNVAEEFPTYDEEEEDEEVEEYDSEDGTLVPMDPEDLDRIYEEEEIRWALANYQDDRKKRKASGKGKSKGARPSKGKGRGKGKGKGRYSEARSALTQNRLARGWQSHFKPNFSHAAKGRTGYPPNLGKVKDLEERSRCHTCKKLSLIHI